MNPVIQFEFSVTINEFQMEMINKNRTYLKMRRKKINQLKMFNLSSIIWLEVLI